MLFSSHPSVVSLPRDLLLEQSQISFLAYQPSTLSVFLYVKKRSCLFNAPLFPPLLSHLLWEYYHLEDVMGMKSERAASSVVSVPTSYISCLVKMFSVVDFFFFRLFFWPLFFFEGFSYSTLRAFFHPPYSLFSGLSPKKRKDN